MKEIVFNKNIFGLNFEFFCLAQVPANVEGAGPMTCTATGHQGAIRKNSWRTLTHQANKIVNTGVGTSSLPFHESC